METYEQSLYFVFHIHETHFVYVQNVKSEYMNQAKIKLSACISSDMEENTVESDHVEKQIGTSGPKNKPRVCFDLSLTL